MSFHPINWYEANVMLRSSTDTRRKKDKGFTLVEVMVGMTVWGIILMSITMAIPNIALISQKSRLARNANSLANNQIEYFRTMSFDDVQSDVLPQSPIVEEVIQNDVKYVVTTTVKKHKIGASSENAISVDVSVGWYYTALKTPQTTSTWSLFTKSGLSDKQFVEAS